MNTAGDHDHHPGRKDPLTHIFDKPAFILDAALAHIFCKHHIARNIPVLFRHDRCIDQINPACKEQNIYHPARTRSHTLYASLFQTASILLSSICGSKGLRIRSTAPDAMLRSSSSCSAAVKRITGIFDRCGLFCICSITSYPFILRR